MKLSVVIITKNAQAKLEEALKSVKTLADEILVIDGGSTDRTVDIAKKHGARVARQKGNNYSDWRNQGLEEAKGDWIFYLDFDERVTPELAREIKETIKKPSRQAYAIPRRNIILGHEMRHGGWWPDYVKRLFKKDKVKEWRGELHEEPVLASASWRMGHLKNLMIHHKHDSLSEMIEKTNQWSEIEAKMLLEAGHPKMSWWRFIRIMVTELWYRLIVKRGFLDGTPGVIYAIYQMYSRFITYGKLWEMQKL